MKGDSIFYNSLIPHGMVAASEGGCEFHAVVLNPRDGTVSEEYPEAPMIAAKAAAKKAKTETVANDKTDRKFTFSDMKKYCDYSKCL